MSCVTRSNTGSRSRLSESNRRPSHYEVTHRAPHASTAALSPAETRLTREATTPSGLQQLQPNCTTLHPTDAELVLLRGVPGAAPTPASHCPRRSITLTSGMQRLAFNARSALSVGAVGMANSSPWRYEPVLPSAVPHEFRSRWSQTTGHQAHTAQCTR